MKEARIDEVLESIARMCFVHLPDNPVKPHELLELNLQHRAKLGA